MGYDCGDMAETLRAHRSEARQNKFAALAQQYRDAWNSLTPRQKATRIGISLVFSGIAFGLAACDPGPGAVHPGDTGTTPPDGGGGTPAPDCTPHPIFKPVPGGGEQTTVCLPDLPTNSHLADLPTTHGDPSGLLPVRLSHLLHKSLPEGFGPTPTPTPADIQPPLVKTIFGR